MKRIPVCRAVLASTLALFSWGPAAPAQETKGGQSAVSVVLLNEVTLDETVVYLDQIAKLSGGPVSLRQRISRLDVGEFRLGNLRTTVTPEQVKYRLLLAGIAESQFQVGGAKRTLVLEGEEPVSARKILAVADREIRAHLPDVGAPKDIVPPQFELQAGDRVSMEARTPHPGLPVVDVRISVNGKVREIVSVTFEIDARVPSSRLTPTRGDERGRGHSEKMEPLIRSRDLVKIVTTAGSAQVIASGEALQDGYWGDLIRVRNTDSNKDVSARVESREIVLAE